MTLMLFATEADWTEIWGEILNVPGMLVLEPHSEPDLPNRWLENIEEIIEIMRSPQGSLAAWYSLAGGRPRSEKIVFTADTQRRFGAKGRTVLDSPALIGVISNNDQQGCLAAAQISSWTEKGVRQRSLYSPAIIDEVDWALFRSTVGKLERQIKKAAPASLRSHPIMPDAYARFARGELCLWNWGEPVRFPSQLVSTKPQP